jgi:hypothetical protein
VSKDQIFWIFGAAFGAWLMVHCPRAALREYRNGIAKGLNPATYVQRDFAREVQPIAFWLTIVATVLAGLMGMFFFVFGIASIVMG